jgi:hypothetical protein
MRYIWRSIGFFVDVVVVDALVAGLIEGRMIAVIHFEFWEMSEPFDFLREIFVKLFLDVEAVALFMEATVCVEGFVDAVQHDPFLFFDLLSCAVNHFGQIFDQLFICA